jgi:CubicO group peptidase (beta-lactamase class C family)
MWEWLTEDMLPIGGGKLGGKDFFDSLTYHSLDPEDMGHYHYILANNIPSYIIQTRTGMTPEQYAVQKVWPHLGISSEDYKWNNNTDGVTLGSHGLYLTTHAYSKLGMLYLQNGMASENERVVEQSWVERSFQVGDEHARPFGYLWWIDSVGGNLVFCSKGMGGQRMCFDKEKRRVIAIFGHNFNQEVAESIEGEDPYQQKELIDTYFQANDIAMKQRTGRTDSSGGWIHHNHGFMTLLATLASALAL